MFRKLINYLVKKSEAYKQLERRVEFLGRELHNWAWEGVKPGELIVDDEEYLGEEDEEAV